MTGRQGCPFQQKCHQMGRPGSETVSKAPDAICSPYGRTSMPTFIAKGAKEPSSEPSRRPRPVLHGRWGSSFGRVGDARPNTKVGQAVALADTDSGRLSLHRFGEAKGEVAASGVIWCRQYGLGAGSSRFGVQLSDRSYHPQRAPCGSLVCRTLGHWHQQRPHRCDRARTCCGGRDL